MDDLPEEVNMDDGQDLEIICDVRRDSDDDNPTNHDNPSIKLTPSSESDTPVSGVDTPIFDMDTPRRVADSTDAVDGGTAEESERDERPENISRKTETTPTDPAPLEHVDTSPIVEEPKSLDDGLLEYNGRVLH